MAASRKSRRATRNRQRAKPGQSRPCAKCGKVLSRQWDMKRHMARHGEKQFKCEECPYASHTACGLKVHVRTKHTNEKDYCPFDDCPYASGDPSLLYRHKRSAHPEFVPTPRASTIRTSSEEAACPSSSQYFVFRASSRPSFNKPIDTLSDLSALTPLSYSDDSSPNSPYSSNSNISPSSSTTLSSFDEFNRWTATQQASNVQAQDQFQVSYASLEEMNSLMPHYTCQPQLVNANTTPFDQYTYQTHPGYQAVGFPESNGGQFCNSFIFPPIHAENVDISSTEYENVTVDPSLFAIDDYLQAASLLNAWEATASPFNQAWCATIPQPQPQSQYFGSWADSVQVPFASTSNVTEFGSLAIPTFSASMDYLLPSLSS